MVRALALSLLAAVISAQTNSSNPPGTVSPLVQQCGPPGVQCINRYAAVMPYTFFRNDSTSDKLNEFAETDVPSDPSFAILNDTAFVVFDRERGLELLGPNPQYDYIFQLSNAVHEAPVYVPSQNKVYFSQLAPPTGFLPQLVVNLNTDPPSLEEYLSDPPVYAPNGGTFYNGLIYFGASGANDSIGGTEQRISIRTVDPETNKSVTLLNNYYGLQFNNIDDLFIDGNGIIWFTDPQYTWFNRLTTKSPQLRTATYRFDPSTGQTFVVDDTLVQPNGIALSPDGKHVYISDTGAITGVIDPAYRDVPGSPFNQTGRRAVYKFDLADRGTSLVNRRPIFYSSEGAPDGLKVSAEGYVLAGSGRGVDVLDPGGGYVLRVQTNYTVQNFAWAGDDLTEFWIVGQGGASRVRWNLKGVDLSDPPYPKY